MMGLEEFRTDPTYHSANREGLLSDTHPIRDIIRQWLKDNPSVKYVSADKMVDSMNVEKRTITYHMVNMEELERWSPDSIEITAFINPYWSE